MKPLKESPFSYHFLALRNLGSWLYDGKTKRELYWYIGYRLFVTVWLLIGLSGLFFDLYLALGDMKKMTWNLCVTSLVVCIMFKDEEMISRRKTIDTLRLMLHRDAESRSTPEDISINNLAVKEMKIFRIYFYGSAIVFIPTWILARYVGFFYGTKELPIPFTLPPFIDVEDDIQYHAVYAFLGFCAIFGLMIALELELAMYSLLIQISREYKIFVKDLSLINRMYTDEDDEEVDDEGDDWLSVVDVKLFLPKKEVNPWLKKQRTKMLVKTFSARQKTLIEYTEAFESSFNRSFLQQFFIMSILMVALALQCLWESWDFSGNLVYQMGYLCLNILDMFMTCSLSTRIRSQCLEVGEIMYSSLWYRMNGELQKDIAMMIMRSQHPPKITIGKFREVNLGVFMKIMVHLYSWLALIRQLEKSA